MDPPKKNGKINPFPGSNILSKISFSWAIPLIKQGYKRRLEHEDVYRIPPDYETTTLTEDLEREWEKELRHNKDGRRLMLWRAIARAFGFNFCLIGILLMLDDVARFIQPIVLIYLIDYFSEESQMTSTTAYLLATVLCVCYIVQVLVGPHIVICHIKCGMTWQAGVCGLVYRKLLKLSSSSRNSITSGHIIDLVSSDAEKIDWVKWFLHLVWVTPLHVILATTLLYLEIGPTVFSALGMICIIMPFQVMVAKIVAYYKKLNLEAMDDRVGIMGEIVSAMRVIKMYCWEKPFGDIVHALRKTELKFVFKGTIWTSFLTEMFTFNQRLVTAVIVLVYVSTQGTLEAAKIFPAFSLLHLINESLLDGVPWGIKTWLDVNVSVKRLEAFLLMEEIEPRDTCIDTHVDVGLVKVENVSATWSLDTAKQTLHDINTECKKGDVLMITGDVGCGKSSLLSCILGELPVSEGKISCGGSIAYVPQQAWVFSSTLRQNILFGREYDAEKYYKVIKASVLDKDLKELPYGDKTLVGEKGVALSGGQKARLNLARALYADAEIYLLDDPLSAVDAKVGNQIINRCIKNILKNKTVILVTHQLQYLSEASNIIVMEHGTIKISGTYNDLRAEGFDLSQPHECEIVEMKKPKFQRSISTSSREHDHHIHTTELSSVRRLRTMSGCSAASVDIALKSQLSHKDAEHLEEEERHSGSVSWRTYRDYFKAGSSWPVLLFFIFLCILTQAVYNLGDWWLAIWCNSESTETDHMYMNTTLHNDSTTTYNTTSNSTIIQSMTEPTFSTNFYAGIYTVLIISMLIVGLSRSWIFFIIVIRAAKTLHNLLYRSVVRAPIRFFDKTPKGRIINRFSGDMEAVDASVPSIILDFIQSTFTTLGNIILIMILNPYVIVVSIPVIICLGFIRKAYLKTQGHVSRLFSTAKSPMMGHLSNTIEGGVVIRAFQNEAACTKDFEGHYDLFTGMWYTELGGLGWFYFYSLSLAGIFTIGVTYTCVFAAEYLGPGQAGLILSYLSPFLWRITHTLWVSSQVEIDMISVERVLEYTKLDSEKALETDENNKPDPNWPVIGGIQFDQVSFSYATDTPNILHNLNFKIDGGQKIGIVGRTGAGKSSLIQALFQMAEPEGKITVDKVEFGELGLHDVRGSMSIIPQDPVLFSGTIRSNLDPFNEIDDKCIWEALHQVQLKEPVSQLPAGIDSKVIESGQNFSVGQRQLFCLARAILRSKKILILDEATANVDKRTDDLIQETIRQEFKHCTVLTVAHRLNTVMDSDKIMVLDQGHLVEFDIPYTLLQKKGLLYTMVEQTGKEEQERLTDIARVTYENTHKNIL